MSRLAAEVGLKQSSLYYYFPNARRCVAAARRQGQRGPARAGRARSPPTAARRRPSCYRFVRGDVEALCALPFDINEIHRIADPRPRAASPTTGRERAPPGAPPRRHRRAAASPRGELRPVDPRLTALTIMANDEGVQNWYRLGTQARGPAIGGAVADLVVGGLLADGLAGTAVRDDPSGRRRVSTPLLKRSRPVLHRETRAKQTVPTVTVEPAADSAPPAHREEPP